MIQRRTLLLSTLAAGFPVEASFAQSAYPSRPVTITVPGAPGGGGDFAARLLAEDLTHDTGKTFIVENRAGAAGNIASDYVARARPDGSALLLGYSGTQITNPLLYPGLGWDPIKSFTPIALVLTAPQVIVVSSSVPAKTLTEFVAYVKANPGKVNFASSGNGTLQHVGAEMLAYRTGTKMVHVPYKGAGPALADVLSGQVELLITTPPAVVAHLRAGTLRALAVASSKRHPMLPDVPTTEEAGFKDLDLDAWFGLYAPANTPRTVVDWLAPRIEKALNTADFKKRAEDSGTYATYMGPEEFDRFTRSEIARWTRTLKQLDIKLS